MQQQSQLSWIRVAADAPRFETEAGEPWIPIGQNDAITWPDLAGCHRRRDMASVERYFGTLANSGVNVLRLMLEYAQDDDHYFEQPAGCPRPEMVRLWDDVFSLCETYHLRVLLTPFDTFWMRVRTGRHPYMAANGGPCPDGSQMLCSAGTRKAIKERLAFVTRRWGGSGALFAWDLWNEIHPVQGGGTAAHFADFVTDVSTYLRAVETSLHGRAHPQTVSFFLPDLHLDARIAETIFRHPCLDFTSPHFYEAGTIDYPANTVDAALAAGRLMRFSLNETPADRPVFDSEHGPIHGFNDRHITLPEAFDDEYFRHMQWAHLASGGAGGGMRWPYRHPHSLTPGMRAAQKALANFCSAFDWRGFRRRNLSADVTVADAPFHAFASSDGTRAIVYLLRGDAFGEDGRVSRTAPALDAVAGIPEMEPGAYDVAVWNTVTGRVDATFSVQHAARGELLAKAPHVVADAALAIRRVN